MSSWPKVSSSLIGYKLFALEGIVLADKSDFIDKSSDLVPILVPILLFVANDIPDYVKVFFLKPSFF